MATPIFQFAAIEVDLAVGPDNRNITDELNRIVDRSGIENGPVCAS